MSDTEAPIVHRDESWGDDGHIIIELRILLQRELTRNDKELIGKIISELRTGLSFESDRINPKKIKARADWIETAKNIFQRARFDLVYIEEIPNEYWETPNDPWLIVTTQFGHFKVGWRKRVIVIDWSRTVLETWAAKIFPDENVTMEGKKIHAWGYDKMESYLIQIRNAIAVQMTK